MELSDNVTVLERDGRTWYVLGTAHVSQASVDEVRALIDQVQPDTVAVELCEPRFLALTDDSRWAKLDIFEVLRSGKTLFLLANLAVGAYQRRLGAKLGVKPGAELLAAVEKAEQVGAEVALIDREVHITLKRAWANVGFFKKLALLSAILESLVTKGDDVGEEEIKTLKKKAHLSEIMTEFAEALPEVKGPLIDKRDEYLISKAEEIDAEKIVVVVGAGHVPGMVEHFGKPIDRDAIDVIPPKKAWTGLIKWIIPAIVVAAFAWGWQRTGGQSAEQMLYAWVLPNSIAAGLFTLLAGGKWLSVLTAFVGSPITSLNPLINTGMTTGLVEAWQRKPSVEDAQRINEDVQSWRGFMRNPFTRTMVVAVAATLGSAVGAWVGATWVVALLGQT